MLGFRVGEVARLPSNEVTGSIKADVVTNARLGENGLKSAKDWETEAVLAAKVPGRTRVNGSLADEDKISPKPAVERRVAIAW
jgi:hypothetical protein